MRTYFTIQFCWKNLTHIAKLISLDIENDMLPRHCQKPFSIYKFLTKNVSVWCQKKHLHCTFLDPQGLYSWNTLKANVCIFLYISLRKVLFQRRSKIWSGGMGKVGVGGWVRLNIFLKVGLSPSKKIFALYFIESPVKMMKNAFFSS